jgi:hypothetical protein
MLHFVDFFISRYLYVAPYFAHIAAVYKPQPLNDNTCTLRRTQQGKLFTYFRTKTFDDRQMCDTCLLNNLY